MSNTLFSAPILLHLPSLPRVNVLCQTCLLDWNVERMCFFKHKNKNFLLIGKLFLKSSEKEKESKEEWQGGQSSVALPVLPFCLWRSLWVATCPRWTRTCTTCMDWPRFIHLPKPFGVISLMRLFLSLPFSYYFKANTMSSHGLDWTNPVSQCDSPIMRRVI